MNDVSAQLIPGLRPDLEFIKGPLDPDGTTVFLIHDRLNDTYDEANWAQVEILKQLITPLTIDQLMEKLASETTLRLSREEVIAFCQDAVAKGLTRATLTRSASGLIKEYRVRRSTMVKSMLQSYLYFRIPLIQPEKFLERTVGWVSKLASAPAIWCYTLISMLAVIMVFERFDQYIHTFSYFFNTRGIMIYAAAIILLKTIHEFSHAYVSTWFNSRVRSMGIAFILMWPVAFCDVTDSWRLSDRRKRLLISFAGILAESVVAGISLFIWCISPDGPLKSICFVLSSVTIVSTFLVNLNPAMRFDGYYIFSDLFGIDNLQAQGFDYARKAIYRLLFGTRSESGRFYTPKQKVFMITYSVYTWTYRFFLFIGIAVLIYYKFTKSLGIILFSIEILYFIVKPVINVIRNMPFLRKGHPVTLNSIITLLVLTGALLWFVLPLPRNHFIPATAVLKESQLVFIPASGKIDRLVTGRDSEVAQGDLLFSISSPELDAKISITKMDVALIKQQLSRISADEEQRALLQQKKEELYRAELRLSGLIKLREQCQVTAEIDGTVMLWDDTLKEGMYVKNKSVAGRIGNVDSISVRAYVKEHNISHISIGDPVTYFDTAYGSDYKGYISRISPVRVQSIPYQALTSEAGGDIPVARSPRGIARVMGSYYEVEVALKPFEGRPPRIHQKGKVQVVTPPRSYLKMVLSYVYRSLIRESSF